ncbi:MAG: hypothetical protein EXS32_15135 [Opitutus sp.]|nr:hypothetical protein [Opitutus sp.]
MSCHRPFALFFVFAGTLVAASTTPSVRILQLQPTVLFANKEPLAQIGWLTVENALATVVPCELRVSVQGRAGSPQKLDLPSGVSRLNALIPDLSAEADVLLELRAGGALLAAHSQRWQPQRKWKIFLLKSSHEDIGYENYLWMKQKEIAEFIDYGAHLSATGPVNPVEGARTPGGYHFWMETLLFTRYYEAERSTPALRALIEKEVKTGSMGLGAAPSGVHTHWMDYEELARSMYPGRREYKDRFGLDLDTYAIVDNPSFSWSSAQALAQAGYKYAVRLGQPFRTGGNNDYKTTKLPPIFWWEAPDAKSRVLYTWRNHYGINFWFGLSLGGFADLSDLGAANIQREMMSVQSGDKLGPYAYDAVMIPSYRDHDIPAWDNRHLRRWEELYRYPEIKVSDPRDFMVYMEKKYGPELPVLRGDLNNFSADYATIDPHSQGQKRRASRLLPLAEGIGAVAGRANPAFAFPTREAEKAWLRMFDFDEHSWPTSPPAGPTHQFNSQWGKILEGGRALEDAERLFGQSLDALTAQVATGGARELLVFNPLAHARTDLVFTTESVSGLTDLVSGATVALQKLADGKTVFVARDVPAFGYKTYRLAPDAGAPAASSALRAAGTTLENEFYTITFDPASGTVTSILDRELKQELLDPAAPHRFNQIVWVHKNAREAKEGANYSPAARATLTPRTGALVAEMESTFRDAKLGDAVVSQRVRLYAGVKRIDVINELRHVGVLHASKSANRYRDNLFFAFPFKVDGFTARAEQAGGVVRPHDDQLRWGSHDYLAANRWVDVSNARFGVTMAVHNAPIVHFGGIRYNELSINYKPSNSHLYSFAWSNRMAGLFTLCADDMNGRFAYSFTSHAGDWNSGATTRFGWAVASPLEARVVAAQQNGPLPARTASFLAIDAPNVQLTVLKDSGVPGRGWTLRLVETEGKGVSATIEVGQFGVDAAARCDLVENDTGPLEVRNGKVTVPLEPFGFATVRIFARSSAALPAVSDVTPQVVSDASIRLRWRAVAGAKGYNMFRSSDPQEPPSAYSWVGRAVGVEFEDSGLHVDTPYYYRVAAVGAANGQGALSRQVEARTLAKNTAPPAPVTDLGVVRQTTDRLMVCWNKSPEPDIARYLVFRGDQPNFSVEGRTPVAVVKPGGFYLENHVDTALSAGQTYYYQVLPEDWAGNRQTRSAVAFGSTPKESP